MSLVRLCPCICEEIPDERGRAVPSPAAEELKVAAPSRQTMESKSARVSDAASSVSDEEVEKAPYEVLLDMARDLWTSATNYLMPDEAGDLEEEHEDRMRRMDTTQLREHVIAEKDQQQAVSNLIQDEEMAGTDVAETQRKSMKLSKGELVFDGNLLCEMADAALDKETGLVNAKHFLSAANLVPLLMGGLGRAFDFAGSDLNKKLEVADKRMHETASALGKEVEDVTLQDMVEYDIKKGTTHAGKKAAPASRTILRLMWFFDFIAALLNGVADNQSESLKKICSQVYEDTLAPRHNWVLKRAARSGMGMMPQKDVFRKRLGTYGMSEAAESEELHRWAEPIEEVARVMWEYMTERGLETLP